MRIPNLLFALLAASLATLCQAQVTPYAPSGAPQQFTPAQLQADLDQMYRGLQSAHFDLYAFTPKRELDRQYAALRAQLTRPLTRGEAKTQFELFAAHVRMGHTRVDSRESDWQAYRHAGGTAFPLQLRIEGRRAYVTRNLSGLDTIHAGEELIRLNGQPMQRWLERAERHVSAETSYMAGSLMDYDFAIHLWTELGAAEAFDVELARAHAHPRRLRLPARTAAQMDSAGAGQPAVLDLENPLRDARLLGDGVAYLRPGPFYNVEAKTEADAWDVSAFRDFIDGAFARFDADGAERLIIDLRGNPGGDNLFSDLMVSWFATRPFRFASQFKIKVSEQSVAANDARIAHDAAAAGPISRQYAQLYAGAKVGEVVDFEVPLAYPREHKRFAGKVFVLVDRHSYSNAVSVAALVQDYGFGRVLGEPTADMATTYGAMEQFPLANTGLLVGYPKARIVRPNGDLRSRGVTPDIEIATPLIQTPADQVLAKAIAVARRS